MTTPPFSASATPQRRRTRRTLGRLLSTGCVMGVAMTLAAIHQRGDAQTAFQGGGSVTNGDALISQASSANTDTIIVNGSAVIDWTPTDTSGSGSIDFLPAGSTVNFVDGFGTSYTVLNRINPTDGVGNAVLDQVIQLNGTITSTVGGNPGGNVWFYTPGGFLVGGAATIDVGGLVLATSQIDTASSFDGSNGLLSLTGLAAGAPADSTVRIAPGASITANNYVAMVAPRIEQSGTVDVDGNAIYVAAEAADITVNNGFFDIVIPAAGGTGDANGIVHDGTTTGPASTGSTDRQRIFMVAVPKNQVMTMLLSGTIGYTAAASAANEGSAVVLSAGNDIFFSDSASPSGGAGTGAANIAVSGTTDFSNRTTAYALDAITLDAGAGEQIDAASDLILYAQREGQGGLIAFTAAGTGSISVGGTLTADASANASSVTGNPGVDATGGAITLTASGGAIDIGTDSMFDVGARGGDGTTGGTGTGGTIDFLADGGTITGAGETSLFANGYSGSSDGSSGLAAGGGIGGTISLATGTTGALSFGTLVAAADGNDIFYNDPSEPFVNFGDGGDGIGGAILLTMDGGSFTAGDVGLSASGFGYAAESHDSGFGATPFVSGSGIGGLIGFSASGGTATLTSLTMHADGYGGLSRAGDSFSPIGSIAGDGTGGTTSLALSGTGALSLTDLTLSASGTGGLGGDAFDSFSSPPPVTTFAAGDGGDGTGGTSFISLTGGALTATTVKLGADGTGGTGGNNETLGTGGAGGAGTGGGADFGSTGGTHDIGTLIVEGLGTGGAGGAGRYITGFDPVTFEPIYAYDAAPGGAGGAGVGGTASLSGGNGATVATLTMDASGLGGVGGDGLAGGDGGAATNGLAQADFGAGTPFSFGTWTILSLATGGAGGASPSGGTTGAAGAGASGAAGGIALTLADDAAANGTSATWTSDSGIGMTAAGTGLLTLSGDLTAIARGAISLDGIVVNGLASADGSDISISTPSDIAFDHATASAGDFTLTAAGTAGFAGDVTATNISVTSADIDIAAGASLTAANGLGLTNGDSSRRTYVGGADTTAGYSLSAAEIARLFASDIAITAPAVGGISTLSLGSTRSPDLIIGDMTVQAGAGGNVPATGSFTIATPGKARVTGAISFTGLAAGGTFGLFADDALEIIAGSGSIDLRDGAGNPGGTLMLSSDDIIAASAATIDAVGASGSLFERNTLLDVNDGAVSDQGYLRAGTIAIAVVNGLYIQNSGASTDSDARRGFTANSLSITTHGNAEIVINGRLADANGGFATGLAALRQVTINGQNAPAGGYAPGSTVNGCRIASAATCLPSLPDIQIPIRNEDIENQLEPSTDPDGPAGDDLPTVIIEFGEFKQTGFPPLIDEPVTGSGNDDLWTGGES